MWRSCASRLIESCLQWLCDDSELEIGDWVLAFGSPFGLDRTVTQGIISAKSRGLKNLPTRQEFLQTDAAINPEIAVARL